MPDLGLSGYSAAAIAALLASAFAAGLARGFSGFGAALIFMPLASAIIGPKLAAPLLLIIDLVAAAPLIPNAWRLGDRREVAVMAAGLMVGVPAGAFVLTRSDPMMVRWMIAALIGGLLLLLISGWRYRGRPKPPLTIAVGGAAGLLSGLAQIGGPPIVVYWLGGSHTAGTVRANIVIFFAISSVLTALSYGIGGMLTATAFAFALLTGPGYGFGLWLGAHMFGLASEGTFRRACYALIALAGLISLPVFDGILR